MAELDLLHTLRMHLSSPHVALFFCCLKKMRFSLSQDAVFITPHLLAQGDTASYSGVWGLPLFSSSLLSSSHFLLRPRLLQTKPCLAFPAPASAAPLTSLTSGKNFLLLSHSSLFLLTKSWLLVQVLSSLETSSRRLISWCYL